VRAWTGVDARKHTIAVRLLSSFAMNADHWAWGDELRGLCCSQSSKIRSRRNMAQWMPRNTSASSTVLAEPIQRMIPQMRVPWACEDRRQGRRNAQSDETYDWQRPCEPIIPVDEVLRPSPRDLD
jgi:hypothetical protein